MKSINTTEANKNDIQGIIVAGVLGMSRRSCHPTNGTVVDRLDEAACAMYRFHNTKYLANTSFSACTAAEHSQQPVQCEAKDENICQFGGADGCHSCAVGDEANSTEFSIYIPVWWRTCTWQEGTSVPPLCNAPLAIGQTMNGSCSGPLTARSCIVTSIEPGD